MKFIISGLPASGKSYFSKALSSHLNIPRYGFGDFIRAKAIELGIDSSERANLQALGQSMIEEDTFKFCTEFLDFTGIYESSSFILDGLRHIEVLETLESKICLQDIYLIYIETGKGTLRSRLRDRGEINLLERLSIEPTEMQVENHIKSRANLIIDGTTDIELSVQTLLADIHWPFEGHRTST